MQRASSENGSGHRPRLCIYIPSYGRPDACLAQVERIALQRRESDLAQVILVVAINGDAKYDVEKFISCGVDVVVQRPVNLGGNANICLGYEYLGAADYLWILSDDDPIHESALLAVLDALEDDPDLVVGTSGEPAATHLSPRAPGAIVKAGGFTDFMSATIYRCDRFIDLAEFAFESIVTSYPHACVIQEAERRGRLANVSLVRLDRLVDSSLSVAAVRMERSQTSAALGRAFFGGLLAETIGQGGQFDRGGMARWWRRHWHRASMYRRTPSIQQGWADRLARSSPRTTLYWLASLPPYWRLKDRIRPLKASPGESPQQGAPESP